jgi:hypothetical protein
MVLLFNKIVTVLLKMIRCSTWNIMKRSFLTLFFIIAAHLGLFSCKKRDQTPELSDAIYISLKSELEIAQKNVAAEEAQLAKVTAELKQVIPQSGQNKYAKKRVFESQNNLWGYQQQAKYFEIAMEIEKNRARTRYLESLTEGGRPWPDEKEVTDYRVRLKLQRDKLSWGKKPPPGDRKIAGEDVPRGTPLAGDGTEKAPEH